MLYLKIYYEKGGYKGYEVKDKAEAAKIITEQKNNNPEYAYYLLGYADMHRMGYE